MQNGMLKHRYLFVLENKCLIHNCLHFWKVYRVGRENLHTFKIAAISAVSALQRRVIQVWNGNFVDISGKFSKIVKNFPMKRYLHFSGKRQNRPTRIWNVTSKFEAIWGQYGLKPLIFAYFYSNIWIWGEFSHLKFTNS